MVKQLIQRISESAVSGALQIDSPLYGDTRKAAPTEFRVIDISEPEIYFKPTQDPKKAAQSIADATQGLKIFRSYFSPYLEKPVIGFQIPQTKERADKPIIPSFSFDKRVFVSCVEDLAFKYNVSARHVTFGIHGETTFGYSEGATANTKRDYAPVLGQKTAVAVKRHPIFWDVTSKGKVDRIAVLALEVLANQIEPVTSSRIAHELEDPTEKDWKDFDDNMSRVMGKNMFDESVLVSGLSKVCLLDTRNQTGLDEKEIYEWQPRELGNITSKELVKAIRRIGVKETLLFYNTTQWSIPALLDGLFNKRDFKTLGPSH